MSENNNDIDPKNKKKPPITNPLDTKNEKYKQNPQTGVPVKIRRKKPQEVSTGTEKVLNLAPETDRLPSALDTPSVESSLEKNKPKAYKEVEVTNWSKEGPKNMEKGYDDVNQPLAYQEDVSSNDDMPPKPKHGQTETTSPPASSLLDLKTQVQNIVKDIKEDIKVLNKNLTGEALVIETTLKTKRNKENKLTR